MTGAVGVRVCVAWAESVGDRRGSGVPVPGSVGEAAPVTAVGEAESTVGDKNRSTIDSPKDMAAMARVAITREAASHCQPAIIRAFRVL